MNILLTHVQREHYKSTIDELFELCPTTMSRKIPAGNVQQAFVLDAVRKVCDKSSQLLCVGSFEDTACESLIKLGYDVIDIDPVINYSLDDYFNNTHKKFDIVFSTSVIEHVENDELFIAQICNLLNPGGFGILTCDFRDDYKPGDNKPGEDWRLYTKTDLIIRLNEVLKKNNCNMIGEIDYDSPPDFTYGVCTYSFATYMFQKQ